MSAVSSTTDTPKAEAKPKEPPPSATLGELYQFTSPFEKTLLFVAALASTGSGVAMPMMLLAFGDAFEQLGVTETIAGASTGGDQMTKMLLTFVYIGVGMFAGRWFFAAAADYVCHSQLLKYKRAFLKAVLRQDVAWYDVSNPEELSSKFSEAMVKVQKGLSATSFSVFEGIGYGTGGLAMGFYFQPEVAGITLATVPLLILPASVIFYIVENGAKTVTKAYGKAGGIATEALYSMRTVVSLGIERTVEARYATSLDGARRVTVVNSTVMGVSVGLALSAYLVMMAAATIYGAYRLADEMDDSAFDYVLQYPEGNYTYCAHGGNNSWERVSALGQACGAPLVPLRMTCNYAGALAQAADTPTSEVANCSGYANCTSSTLIQAFGFDTISSFRAHLEEEKPAGYNNDGYFGCSYDAKSILLAIFAIMMAGEGYSMAGQPAQNIALARQAVAEILTIINRVPQIDSFSDEGLKPTSVTGEVEVKDVVFSYPTAPEHVVCNGYSLLVPAGKTVALCGASGSGKSTIIQLIERFYDPQSGMITLDGIDIKTLNVRWLRSQLGLVGQEPVLFQGSVAMNIGYGKPGATQAEIEEAAKMANAHGFITENLPDKYDTEVGLKGGRLSGGQKQRVAIARAIIKQPAVLLLDEATSALDNESERVVQAALDEVMATGKRTAIVIAHRLSTIRNADLIAVLQEGRVVEKGTHDTLLELNGLYASLVLSS